jgi:hypothetical protein
MHDVGEGLQQCVKHVAAAVKAVGDRAGGSLGTGAELAGQGLQAAGRGLRKGASHKGAGGQGALGAEPKPVDLPVPEKLKKVRLLRL